MITIITTKEGDRTSFAARDPSMVPITSLQSIKFFPDICSDWFDQKRREDSLR